MAEKITSIWQLDEFAALEPQYQARRTRLQQSEKYYLGTMYDETAGDLKAWAVALPMKKARRQIRVLFQPLAGAVHVDVALIPGGWELDADSQQHVAAVHQVLKSSRWMLEQDMYVHSGAAMGQTVLKVVDNPGLKTVTIQPLRPDSVLPVRSSVYSSDLQMAIIIGMTTNAAGEAVEVAEVIEPGRVRTYVAGQPAGVEGRPETFENTLGEVNIIDVPFLYTGRPWGESTYESAKQPLDGVNHQANDLEENIKRHIEPQWAAMVENPERNAVDLVKSGDNVWWFPTGSNIEALVADLDINGVLSFVKEIKDDLKSSLPELLVFSLVGLTRIAVPAVEVQLLPLTMKIRRARRSLDDGLARALQMAGRAYARMGGAPELAALNDPLLGFREDRPVIFIDALSALSLEQAQLATEANRLGLEDQRRLLAGDNSVGIADE